MKRFTLILLAVLALTVAWLWVTGTDCAWYGESWIANVWRYWGVPWLIVGFWSAVGYVIGKRLNVGDGVLAWGVGAGLVGIGAWLMGIAGLLYMPLTYGIGAGVLVWGWMKGDWNAIFTKTFLPPIQSSERMGRDKGANLESVERIFLIRTFHVYSFVALLGLLWYIVRTAPMTCYPAVGWDECNSHLALPIIYVANHSVPLTGVWWVNFSTFPQLSEMLTTLQMMFTDTPGAVWSYVFLVGTCVVIYRWVVESHPINRNLSIFDWKDFIGNMGGSVSSLKSYGNRPGQFNALLAVLCFLSVPAVTMYSQQTLVDLPLTFFLTAGTWCLWRRDWSTGLPLLALACGVKYTGIIYSGLAILIFGVSYVLKDKKPHNWWHRAPCLPVSTLVVLAGVLGVYLRNVAVFGNPFFPFGSDPAIGGVDVTAMLEPFRVHWSWETIYRLTLSEASPWNPLPRPSDLGWWFPVTVVGGMFDRSRVYWLCLAFIGCWLLIAGVWEARYLLPVVPALTVSGVCGLWKLLSKQS